MAVRNWWIEAEIDGRATRLEGGPQKRDGSMSVVIYQRHEGGILRALSIEAFALSDGRLKLVAYPNGDAERNGCVTLYPDHKQIEIVTTRD